ncbi:MAG TPA: type 2 lanthipeptide synthetase LanM family protein [Streptomyces sp.]
MGTTRYRADHAAFLRERHVAGTGAPTAADLAAVDEWRESAYLDESTMARRLAVAGISRETFAALVAGKPFSAAGAATAWVPELDTILSGERKPADSREPVTALYGETYEKLLFSGLLDAFICHYADRLRQWESQAALDRIALTEHAHETLVDGLATGLLEIAHRTLILELNVARDGGLLTGETPEERYAYYNEVVLRRDGYRTQLFTEYPVLARAMVQHGTDWLANTVETLTRLAADLPELRRQGLLLSDHVVVTGVRSGLGDPHNHGRSVSCFEFEDGSALVHKPRPVDPERTYAEALDLLNELTGLNVKSMRVLARPGYGWCEFLEHEPCDREADLPRFYVHIGAMLAVLHVLGAVDIHMTNVIAVGDSPVPVDLETILQHTSVRHLSSAKANERALDFLAQSVLATLVVPLRTFGDGVTPGIDVSAIGGGTPQLTPRPMPAIAAPFTDQMHIVGVRKETKPARNRPVVDGRAADPARYTGEVVRGFLDGYDAIASSRERFAALLRSADDIEVRFLARATRRYDLFRMERFHPDYLRDGLATEQLLEKLWTAATTRDDLVPVIEAERRQLLRADIPAFHTKPGSTALFQGGEVVAEDFFTEPSGQTLQRKLAMLGPDHRATQLAILRDSLDTLGGAVRTTTPSSGAPDRVPEPSLDELTRRTLNRLADEAILGDDDCAWVGIGTDGIRDGSLSFQPLNTSFYDGLAGLALTFGYAAELYQDERFADLSRRSMRPVVDELRRRAAGSDVFRVGAYAGLSGTIYAVSHQHHLTGDPEYLELLESSLPHLRDCARQEDSADLVAGLAGCAVVAAGLHDRYRMPILADIVAICAERLAATAVDTGTGRGWSRDDGPPLGGMSHGSAGIGWALLEAARVLDDDRVRRLGVEALEHDMSLRIPGKNAWQDLRGFTDLTGIVQEHPTLWCHGSTGIGMARLLAHRRVPDPRYLAEAEAALAATAEAGLLGNHCLCHGDSGSLELFTLAEPVLSELGPAAENWRPQRKQRAEALVKALASGGPRFGRITGGNIPGLLLGRAGVCLTLMRLLDTANAPSVLVLEPAGAPERAA